MTTTWNPRELIGATIGSCTLESPLGSGGMGAVYLARQERPHRHVAVKVLRPEVSGAGQSASVFVARFRREADATAALDHANIIPIYEFGQDGDIPYLVMPYQANGSLAALLAREGRLSLSLATVYAQQAAAALDAAHRVGIVHRDVKPSNLLLHPDGRLLLTDFGIARAMERMQVPLNGVGHVSMPLLEDADLTDAGRMMGTPEYMAPEQIRGQPLGPATDVYALGIVVYTMLTGRTPFGGGDQRSILTRQLTNPPAPIRTLRPEIPARVEEVIFWSLAKDPAERPVSAGVFAAALAEAGRGRALSAFFSRTGSSLAPRLVAMSDKLTGAAGATSAYLLELDATGRPPDAPQVGPSSVTPSSLRVAPAPTQRVAPLAQGSVAPSAPATRYSSPPARAFVSEADAPTLYDAASFDGPPPVWPRPANPSARFSSPGARLWRVLTAGVLMSLLITAVIAGSLYAVSLLNAPTPRADTPAALAEVIAPTATPQPTATPTPVVATLSVTPLSVTLECKGGKRSQRITVTNNSPDQIDWEARLDHSNQLQVTVTPMNGSLDSGESKTITLTLFLAFTNQQGTLQITPTSDGAGPGASVSYTVQGCGQQSLPVTTSAQDWFPNGQHSDVARKKHPKGH